MLSGDRANCDCVSIDDFFLGMRVPTLVKLDVEGAEPKILKGARRTLASSMPKLMVAIYHARWGPDWATVPEIFLNDAACYDFYCEHHTPWYSESIVYALRAKKDN
ncbi:MAG: FkbM family methyltransferase [Desulfovibrio sp.]|nr:FkbM family methyltransferase [Desulfovibrio sp.]